MSVGANLFLNHNNTLSGVTFGTACAYGIAYAASSYVSINPVHAAVYYLADAMITNLGAEFLYWLNAPRPISFGAEWLVELMVPTTVFAKHIASFQQTVNFFAVRDLSTAISSYLHINYMQWSTTITVGGEAKGA